MSKEQAQKEIEEALEKETQWLMSLTPEKRTQYVKGVIESLGDSFKEIANAKGKGRKAKAAFKFLKELNNKTTDILPPIVYSIKPEFQQVYIGVLQELAAVMEKVKS